MESGSQKSISTFFDPFVRWGSKPIIALARAELDTELLVQDYVVSPERVERGETPGALTYSERIARKFMEGDTVSAGQG